MRSALLIFLFSIHTAFSQQDPVKPPQETAPRQTQSTETVPSAVDPLKMAEPKTAVVKPAASASDSGYVLGPEDQISVFVFQGQEFTGDHMVRPDGKITVNLIGDVQASGLTPVTLAQNIKDKIKAYVNDPDVTVKVLAVKSKKYLINGEVNRPGEYPLVVPINVFQALANAGGFKDFANKKKITIIHENNTRDFFNYNEVLAGKKMDQNIFLQPGDIIVVK